MDTSNSDSTHAPSQLREDFQQWLDSYEPDRLRDIDTQPVLSMLDSLANSTTSGFSPHRRMTT
jgi:hypothetical protein